MDLVEVYGLGTDAQKQKEPVCGCGSKPGNLVFPTKDEHYLDYLTRDVNLPGIGAPGFDPQPCVGPIHFSPSYCENHTKITPLQTCVLQRPIPFPHGTQAHSGTKDAKLPTPMPTTQFRPQFRATDTYHRRGNLEMSSITWSFIQKNTEFVES